MPFVKQPNGLLARFSTIVDDFTHLNLTEEEAFNVAFEDGVEDLRERCRKAVECGVKDEQPRHHGVYGDGTARWRDAIQSIETNHGKKKRKQRERECSG